MVYAWWRGGGCLSERINLIFGEELASRVVSCWGEAFRSKCTRNETWDCARFIAEIKRTWKNTLKRKRSGKKDENSSVRNNKRGEKFFRFHFASRKKKRNKEKKQRQRINTREVLVVFLAREASVKVSQWRRRQFLCSTPPPLTLIASKTQKLPIALRYFYFSKEKKNFFLPSPSPQNLKRAWKEQKHWKRGEEHKNWIKFYENNFIMCCKVLRLPVSCQAWIYAFFCSTQIDFHCHWVCSTIPQFKGLEMWKADKLSSDAVLNWH